MLDKNNFAICPITDCTGCGVCSYVCKHDAIRMCKDIYGFQYPKIDMNKCVKCKICQRKCPSVTSLITFNHPQKAFACYNKNENERNESSSGGLGYLLAKNIIRKNGVVYGCAFVNPWGIKNIRCTSIDEIKRLRGSKYVQSDMSFIYSSIKKDLSENRLVLFIGTPCQVAAVRVVFPNADSLFLVDLICHGVSSMQFLKETLPLFKNIDNMRFRDGARFRFSLIAKDWIWTRELSNDIYMKGFFNGTIFRPNCYNCQYARQDRISDMTIGDFWGLKSNRIDNQNKGISLALINTAKGISLFSQCKINLYIEERPLEEAFAGNGQLNHPFKKTFRTYIFRYLYPKLGYNKALWCALPDKVLVMKLKYLLKI